MVQIAVLVDDVNVTAFVKFEIDTGIFDSHVFNVF